MQFRVMRNTRDRRLENVINIKIYAQHAKLIHDYLMETSSIVGRYKSWHFEPSTGIVTFKCEVSYNHVNIGRVMDFLIPFDQESVF